MQIYKNKRAGRAHMLLWVFAVPFALSLIYALLGVLTNSDGAVENGLIVAAIALPFLLGVEFYCRRYITEISKTDAGFEVRSRSLTGQHLIRGDVKMGELKQDGDVGKFDIDTQYHWLRVGRNRRRYIMDVTGNAKPGKLLAKVIRGH